MLSRDFQTRSPRHARILGIAATSLLLALFGTYWDDAWHTDKGRDTFWTPPHLLLYAGIGIAGTLVALHALLLLREGATLTSLLRRRTLMLALVGAGATLASAPIDDWWHRNLGRDAVLWSPPHMLGLFGVLLLVTGIALELHRYENATARAVRPLAHAGIVAVLASLVFEYDSDVPQFSLFWYLPVLALATLFAFRVIQAMSDDPFAPSKATLVYTGLMGSVILFLTFIRASQPLLPVIAIGAFIHDAVGKRFPNPWAKGLAYVLSIFLLYPAYLGFEHILLTPVDIIGGFGLAAIGMIAITAMLGRKRLPHMAAGQLIVLLLLIVPVAAAHDPGQGTPLGQALMRADAEGSIIRISATLVDTDCAQYGPASILARRAGETLVAKLEPAGVCASTGSISVPTGGRWFIYGEWQHGEGEAEAWIPIQVDGRQAHAERTSSLYEPPATSGGIAKTLAAGTLYFAEILLVGGLIVTVRRGA